jgi:cytochrome c2
MFVGNNSPHALDEFGCATCHAGRGRGTDFNSAAHTPATEQQAEEWREKYDWKPITHWDKPMYPLPYVEAGCLKCHSGETSIKGAEKLNLGLQLIERAGCYSCHQIDKYKDWPKPGPDLTKLAAKTSKEWAYRWIQDPQSFRHNTWMPAFFGLSNNSTPEMIERTTQEIHAMVHYLFKESVPYQKDAPSLWGDAEKGKQIVESVGCLACHNIEHSPSNNPMTQNSLRREQGPNLIGLGSKTQKEWLYNWLKDPTRYHPETRMPNLRLTDKEAADAAAYLAQDQNAIFDNEAIPSIRAEIINDIVKDFLVKSSTSQQAEAQLSKMTIDEKLSFSGEKLIAQYGCYSCHNIKGFENAKPIGTELTEEGSKDVHKLDFGFVHIDHTRQGWFTQKLKDPRIFDQGKIKVPDEKLRMPNYYFSDQEIEAIVTAILGFVKDHPNPSKLRPQTVENQYIEEGQKLVRQFNCQGCHIMEGDGGAIRPKVIDYLLEYQNLSLGEAEALVSSFSPPNLIGEGSQVQSEWLFEFLHQPETIRPWLGVRMPTYALNVAHLNALVKYFNALDDEEFPFASAGKIHMSDEEFAAGQKLFSTDYFDCTKCHIVGTKMPGGSPENWAPNFEIAGKRLKLNWLRDWIKNPQDLLPGTKMPTFYDPQYFESSGPEDILSGNESAQINALADYIMTLTTDHAETQTAPTTTPAASQDIQGVSDTSGNSF